MRTSRVTSRNALSRSNIALVAMPVHNYRVAVDDRGETRNAHAARFSLPFAPGLFQRIGTTGVVRGQTRLDGHWLSRGRGNRSRRAPDRFRARQIFTWRTDYCGSEYA